jgi:hypothetical protein
LILTPVYVSIDGSIIDDDKNFNVELKETNINFCPTIINAIIALSNSAGTIIKVCFQIVFYKI